MISSLAIALAAALSTLPSGRAAPAMPTFRAAITGRLVFTQDGKAVPFPGVQRLSGGKRVGMAFRSGWSVAPARIEPDGRFAAEVEPGTWRLEWIDVGDGAEVLATPLELSVRDGSVTCAGQISIDFQDVQSELGANAAGTVTVQDRCGELDAKGKGGGRLRVSLAKPAGDPAGDLLAVDWWDVLSGLRTEGVFQGDDAAVRLSWSLPFRRPLAWQGNLLVSGGVVRYWGVDVAARDALEAGAGFSPYGGIELSGGIQVGVSGDWGTTPWANLRWGGYSYALNARALFTDGGVTWAFGLDLTPFHVVGSFL